MSISYFDFALKHAKATWGVRPLPPSKSWAQEVRREKLAKVIYYAIWEELDEAAQIDAMTKRLPDVLFEDLDYDSKTAYIASADQLIADLLLEMTR